MCELFGVCSSRRVDVKAQLKEFFSHSEQHCHGWGMATFYGDAVSLEKEPLCANRSQYLHQRLRSNIEVGNMIAHIRLASVGRLFYENTHPFIRHDNRGGCWTLAHNGTIFKGIKTDRFERVQEGQTDSERILLYIVDEINRRQDTLEKRLSPEERFGLLANLLADLSVGNKLNLLLWDGSYMYAHSNYANTLYINPICEDSLLFSTHPLSETGWHPLPFLKLTVYKDGHKVYEGKALSTEYTDPEENFEYKYLDYANL